MKESHEREIIKGMLALAQDARARRKGIDKMTAKQYDATAHNKAKVQIALMNVEHNSLKAVVVASAVYNRLGSIELALPGGSDESD